MEREAEVVAMVERLWLVQLEEWVEVDLARGLPAEMAMVGKEAAVMVGGGCFEGEMEAAEGWGMAREAEVRAGGGWEGTGTASEDWGMVREAAVMEGGGWEETGTASEGWGTDKGAVREGAEEMEGARGMGELAGMEGVAARSSKEANCETEGRPTGSFHTDVFIPAPIDPHPCHRSQQRTSLTLHPRPCFPC